MWKQITEFKNAQLHPSPRRAHTASAVGDVIVVFGGRGPPAQHNEATDIVLLDTSTKPLTWIRPKVDSSSSSGRSSRPSLRWNHTATVIGRSLYVFGGENDQTLHGDLFRLELDLLRWTQFELDGPKPCARYAHSACAWSRRIVVFGGSCQSHLDDTWQFDTDKGEWEELQTTGDKPSPRCGHAGTALGDNMWVFGGLSSNFRNDLFCLNLRTAVWRQVTTSIGRPPSIRGHLTVTRVGRSLLFFGGWNGGKEEKGTQHPQLMNDLHVLSVDDATGQCSWTEPWLQGVGPSARNTHTASIVGNRVYIFAGWNRKECFNDLHSLSVESLLDYEQAINFKRAVRQSLQHCREFSDVTFLVGEERVLAHKCILAARSDYFARLFTSGMEESRSSEIEVSAVTPQPAANFRAFTAFIEYLYGSDLPGTPEECIELLCLADYYNDDTLRELCDHRARSLVTTENAAGLLMLADKLKDRDLLEFYLSFVVGSYREVQPSLSNLPGHLKDCIMERLVHRIPALT